MIINGGRLQGSTFRDQPQYVTAGLVEYLDAANYSGSGTTWHAQVGSNATLINSPTWVNTGPTYFTFNPNNGEWASAPNLGSLSTWTVEAWFKTPASDLSSYISSVVCNEWDYATSLNFSLGINNQPSSANLVAGFFDGNWHSTSGFAPVANTWYQLVGTYDGSTITQYVNAVSNSTLSYSGTPTSGGDIRIASRWDAQVPPGDFFPGDISIVRIYNTALSGAEVLQNFTATRSRFGI